MSIKESNEITVKIKCELNELYKILEEKGFAIVNEFSMDDSYFIPQDLEIEKMSIREIVSKALLVRYINDKSNGIQKKKLTFKKKEIDIDGNILNQESISCDVKTIEDAKKLLIAIGYVEIMNITEKDIVYEKDGFEIAIKDIDNGDKLIEIETEADNIKLDTIEKLKETISEINIPIYTDNYFVKKAEIELQKILNR